MLFILPPLAGMVIGAALCLSHRLKFLTSYAVCIPLFGTFGGWIGMNTGASSSLAKLHVWNLTDLMAVSTLFLVGTCGRIWDRCKHWRIRGIMHEPDVRAPEVIPSLEHFAESSDVYIRVSALQGLRKIGSLTSAPVFLRALNEPREDIGFIAMMSLIELAGGGSFDWVPRYDEFLGAPDFYAAQFRQWWEAEGEARAQARATTRLHP